VTVSAKKLREAGSPKPVAGRVYRRLSTAHVLIAVVVILAFVLNLLVLSDRGATTLVAMAQRPIPAGSPLEPGAVRLVSVDSSFEGLPSLLRSEDLDRYDGWLLKRSIPTGAVVGTADLVEPTDGEGLRVMSLPVAVEHAAGGGLVPGDRVDVISVFDGVARFVALDLEVAAVADGSSGAIGSSSQYHVVVAVDAAEALSLAGALDQGSMEIIRSTGAAGVTSESGDGG
jgi:hypothetical protein